MKARPRYVILLVILFALCLAAYLGSALPLSVQSELLSFLMFPAAATFSVTGVWLAVVFPEVLHGIYKTSDIAEKEEIVERGRYLLQPLMVSVLVEIAIIGYKLTVAVAGEFPAIAPIFVQRGFSFLFVVTTAGAVVYALFYSVIPGIDILYKARFHTSTAKLKARFRGKRKKL